jgi:hypothetical protein
MAALVTAAQVGRGFPQKGAVYIPVSIDANGATYAASTGGLPFDIYTLIQLASPFSAPINYQDIIGFVGITRAGYTPGQFAVGTVTSTTIPCTIKLWNGTTQFADGACTQILDGFIVIQRGGTN